MEWREFEGSNWNGFDHNGATQGMHALTGAGYLNSSLPHKNRTSVRRARQEEHEHRSTVGCTILKKGARLASSRCGAFHATAIEYEDAGPYSMKLRLSETIERISGSITHQEKRAGSVVRMADYSAACSSRNAVGQSPHSRSLMMAPTSCLGRREGRR